MDDALSFSLDGVSYHFRIDEYGFVDEVSFTTRVPLSTLPKIEDSEVEGIKSEITIPASPGYLSWAPNSRVIEGLLGFFGLRKIEFQYPQQEWIPESDEELAQIQLYSFAREKPTVRDSVVETVPKDLLIRIVARAEAAKQSETVLSFYRKGCADMDEDQHIEAIYDFFFVFESLYGDGQFRARQLKTNLKSSRDFTSAVESIRNNFHQRVSHSHEREMWKCVENFTNKTAAEVIDDLVDLRGFLHHHSAKRKDIWHPDDRLRYRHYAIFCQLVAFTVCYSEVQEALFGPEAEEYLRNHFPGGS